MRRVLPLLALCLMTAAGCGHCGSSTGWRFEMLSPPVVMSPSIVASGPAPLGTVGLGTVQHTESQAVQLIQQGPCVTQSVARRPAQSVAPDCQTLEEACERIRALEAAMRRAARPDMAPMPNKTPEKPHDEE